jgi:outer membrane receptor protein involved in Fe transport
MNRPFSSRHLLLASAAAAAFALPVQAQTPPQAPAQAGSVDPAAVVLPEVNVQATAWRAWESVPGYVAPVTTTGSKTDTPLIEAPQSVGVVTRSQIDDQAALSVSQALRYTAGVLGEVRPSARYDSVFVRGFGGQGTGAAFVNFLDGLRQGRGLYFGVPTTDPWLMERIEVLRGPASVLYGQTGAGGLVNLVSRRPSPVASNEVRIEAGSNALMPSDFGRIPRNFQGGDPNFNRFTRTQASIGYQLEHRLNDIWTVRQNFRYSHIDAEVNVISVRGVNGRTGTRGATYVSDHANAYALDNQAQATFTTGPLEHTALFGVDWQRTSARARQGLNNSTVPTLDVYAPSYYQVIPTISTSPAGLTNQEIDQVGFYAQDQIALDRFRFNVGVRYDRADIGTTTHQASGANASQSSQFDDKVTWRAGALYLFDNGLAPYASYSTSFLPNTGTAAPQRGSGTFAPTTGEQYEIGIKYQPPGMNSFIQLAAYHIRQQNVLTQDPVYMTYSTPQGEIRSRGIELEGRASLTDGLDLLGAYSYIDAEVTNSNTAGVSGNRVPQVPNHMASGWANYRFLEGPLRGLQLGGGVRYVGSTYGNDINSFKVDAVTLFDAAIRYDLGARFESARGLEVAVNAQNVEDKDYIASCASLTACYYGTGRVVLGSIRARW